MATIKTNLSSENTCGLKIENTSGYYNSVTNPTGFLIPTDVVAGAKNYLLNDVRFFTFLIKNNWDGTFSNLPIAGNAGKSITYDVTKTFDTLMEEGLVNQHTFFSEDGYYSAYQLAIPLEAALEKPAAAATRRYYVKPDGKVYVKVAGVAVDAVVNLYNLLISCTINWSTTNIVMLRSNVVSKCFLEGCLNSTLEIFAKYYTDPLCTKNNTVLKELRERRDLLFAVTNTIQYYVELGQYYQAAKLIHDVSFCNICRDYILENPSLNCNCHG
jgi:hypothetical protein